MKGVPKQVRANAQTLASPCASGTSGSALRDLRAPEFCKSSTCLQPRGLGLKFHLFALPNVIPKNFEKNDQLWWFSLATPTGWGRIRSRRDGEVLGRSKQSVLKLIGGSRCKRCARPTGEGEFRCQTSRLPVEPTVRKQSSLRSLQRIAFWTLTATPLRPRCDRVCRSRRGSARGAPRLFWAVARKLVGVLQTSVADWMTATSRRTL